MSGKFEDPILDRGLPSDPDIERYILGWLLHNYAPEKAEIARTIEPALDFSIEKHRRIFLCALGLIEREEHVDVLTVANELRARGWLESVDGYSYLVDLNQNWDVVADIATHIRILRDKSGLRSIITRAQKMIDQAFLSQHTPAEILELAQTGFEEIRTSDDGENDGGRTPEEVVLSFPGGVNAFLDPAQRPKGLPTGFTNYDELTSGLHKGEITVIAASTSAGKTALALNIAGHLALTGSLAKTVDFYSLEMSSASLMNRLVCSHARVDAHKFRMGYLNKEERHRLHVSLSEVTESHLRFYEQGGMSAPEIVKRIIRRAKESALHLVIIDYLQLIQSHSSRGDANRNQEISVMSRQFKMAAKEAEVPIILLSQLNRAYSKRTDPRPQLSDLRDSGSIEQDADVVDFIYREELHRAKDREDLKGLADLIIAKQRNGPIATVKLRYLGPYTKFENRSEDEPPEGE